MSLKVNTENIRSIETVCACAQEQSVELDYVLPDYYPEIFRIIKCTASPKITSCAVSGDRISYELTVGIRVIYCSDGGSSGVHSVEQKQVFNRTVSLDSPQANLQPHITAAVDYVNCRAVNRRRIDIRGAVTVNVCVSGEKETQVVCDAFGSGIQLKKVSALCPVAMLHTAKRVTVSDEFELDETMPPIGSVLRIGAHIASSDKKLIAGRLAAKGDIKITLLYAASADYEGENTVATMQYTLPYSQVIDLEGIDESYDCRIMPEVISCELTPRSDGSGSSRAIQCEVLMLIECSAVRRNVCDFAVDEYSTVCSTSHTVTPIKIPKESAAADSTYIVKGICESKDSPFSVIYDSWCDTSPLHVKNENGRLILLGNVHLFVMGKSENGDISLSETEVPIEEDFCAETGLDLNDVHDDSEIRIDFPVVSCGYNISADNSVEVKAEIGIRGYVTDYTVMNCISAIECGEDDAGVSDYALRLYFAKAGEELWGIAKRYRANAVSVAEENDIDGDILAEDKMLLIPCSD